MQGFSVFPAQMSSVSLELNHCAPHFGWVTRPWFSIACGVELGTSGIAVKVCNSHCWEWDTRPTDKPHYSSAPSGFPVFLGLTVMQDRFPRRSSHVTHPPLAERACWSSGPKQAHLPMGQMSSHCLGPLSGGQDLRYRSTSTVFPLTFVPALIKGEHWWLCTLHCS